MFKFDFDIEDADEEVIVPQASSSKPQPTAGTARAPAQPCHSISLAELIKLLPESFSYSPLAHPTGGLPLLRRDLFDARFQLAQGEHDAEAGYIDADTDLIPGTYEGGLKSWEGGLDLVEVLARSVGASAASEEEERKVAEWVRGSRVLEVGCGTGLPSAYILRSLLSSPGKARTVLHLQDYNLPVLSLVTLPNLVLASLTALPLSARSAAEAAAAELSDDEDVEDDEREDVRLPFDASRAGTLDVTPALIAAFTEILDERGIELRFTYGDWSGMATEIKQEEAYGLILSAETIYEEASVGPLLDVLASASKRAVAKEEKDEALEDSLGALQVRDDWASKPLATAEPVVLVAAKVLYFGVGGGLESFLARVKDAGGLSVRVRDWVRGVGRAVVRIGL